MKRRSLLALLGGVAAPRPSAVFAQTSPKVYRVGLVGPAAPVADSGLFGAPLIRGLAQFGYVQGRNLVFERRAVEGQIDHLPHDITELAESKVDVIVAVGYHAALAAKQQMTVPVVVFATGDPVAAGLVASLARPGGNLTGLSDWSTELTPKRLELLKEIAPGLRRVSVMWNAGDVGMTLRYRAAEAVATAMGISIQALGLREPGDFEEAFKAMNREQTDAILVVADSFTSSNSKKVFQYAATHQLPAIYELDFLVRAGGLMSYGPDLDESLGRAASLVDRILKGAKPADLPVEQATRFRLAINLKTARALGLTIPTLILALADEVIG